MPNGDSNQGTVSSFLAETLKDPLMFVSIMSDRYDLRQFLPSLLEFDPINFHQTRFRVRLLRKLNRSTNHLILEAKFGNNQVKKSRIFPVEIIDEDFCRFSSLVNKSRVYNSCHIYRVYRANVRTDETTQKYNTNSCNAMRDVLKSFSSFGWDRHHATCLDLIDFYLKSTKIVLSL